jgi:hypothetical protein
MPGEPCRAKRALIAQGQWQIRHIVIAFAGAHNPCMQAPFRSEFNAKLSAAEARMDRRVARIEDSARAVAQSVRDQVAAYKKFREEMRVENKETRAEMRALRQEVLGRLSSLKITIITTAIATALTIVLGVASFNAALTSNMLAAFQTGLQSAAQKAPAETPSGR